MDNYSIRLNTGTDMPAIGLGTWRLDEGKSSLETIAQATKSGYRMIDTASMYGNEVTVGRALRVSGVAREELFVVTKLHNNDQGYQSTLVAYEASLERLGLDYIDLYLIHSPSANTERYIESWQAMEQLYRQKRVRAIGVSNFWPAQLEVLRRRCIVTPAVNQIQLHPYMQQRQTRQYCKEHGIAVQAYSPLAKADNSLLQEAVIVELSAKYHKTPAQIILRWHVDSGLVPLPKTSNDTRLKENLEIFDFQLSSEEMDRIALLDQQPGV